MAVSDLHGQRVVVTRSAEDCDAWAARLERAGAIAITYPCITVESIDTPTLRNELAAAAATADWLIFTSRRGVETFAALQPAGLPLTVRIAAVGVATADAARKSFGRVDHVGAGTGATLADSLPLDARWVAGARCVLALASNASPELERKLATSGAACSRYDVYRTIPAAHREPKQPLSALRADRILFASPSAVEGFLNQVDLDAAASVVTIGPSTSAAARSRGLTVAAEAREPSLRGLMEVIDG
jgi:uroporphyrinogen-III synthase